MAHAAEKEDKSVVACAAEDKSVMAYVAEEDSSVMAYAVATAYSFVGKYYKELEETLVEPVKTF